MSHQLTFSKLWKALFGVVAFFHVSLETENFSFILYVCFYRSEADAK